MWSPGEIMVGLRCEATRPGAAASLLGRGPGGCECLRMRRRECHLDDIGEACWGEKVGEGAGPGAGGLVWSDVSF
jgi:hypothetical protein